MSAWKKHADKESIYKLLKRFLLIGKECLLNANGAEIRHPEATDLRKVLLMGRHVMKVVEEELSNLNGEKEETND